MSKKSSKTKIEIDKEISKLSKDLTIIRKKYTLGGSTHNIFENIPGELKLDSTVEKGRRVMTAHYPESHDVYLVEYHNVGTPSYPHGGIKVYNRSTDEYRIFYPDGVVKHKNLEFYKKNLE
jgi:hypothetical protein